MNIDRKDIIFKIKKSIKPQKRLNIFAKKNIKNKGVNRAPNKFFKYLVWFLSILLAIGTVVALIIFTYKFILQFRDRGEENRIEIIANLDIPSYPNAQKIFAEDIDNETVRSFISKGNIIYRLPKDTTITDVFAYYDEQLPSLNWQKVNFVPLESESQLYGSYYIKDGKGLRIYSRLNDIWYQSITEKEAKNGMEDVVKKDTERKLLLLNTEKSELLPNYPFRLSFPSEYTATYYSTNISSFQGVNLKKIGSNYSVFIEPIGYNGGNTLDGYIEKFIKEKNSKQKSKWIIKNSVTIDKFGREGVKATIEYNDTTADLYAIYNPTNTLIYIIGSYQSNDPFLKFVIDKITPSVLN